MTSKAIWQAGRMRVPVDRIQKGRTKESGIWNSYVTSNLHRLALPAPGVRR